MIFAGGFCLFSPMTAIAIQFGQYSPELSIYYYAGFAFVCAFATVYSISRNADFLKQREVGLTALFWLLYIARLIWSCYFSNVSLRLPGDDYIYYAVGGCLIPMIAFFRVMDDKSSAVAYWSLLVSSGAGTGICVLVYRSLIGTEFIRLGMSGDVSLSPLQVAYLGSTIIVLATYDILYRQEGFRLRSFRLLLSLLFLATGFLALVIGASKGALLDTLVCILAAVAGRLYVKRFVASSIIIFAMALLFPLLAGLTEILGSGLVDRLRDTSAEYGPGGRIALVTDAVSEFAQSPIFGSGIEVESLRSYPHNVIVEAFLTTGIFGGTLFFGLCVWAILRSMRILVVDPNHGWIALLFILNFVFSLVSGALYLSWAFWFSYAAVMSIRLGGQFRNPRLFNHGVGRSSYRAARRNVLRQSVIRTAR
jgi:O-antigen ligase